MAARQAVDFEDEIPYRINTVRMREERIERAKKILKKHGLEGVLCFLGYNVRYVSSMNGAYAFLPADGDPIVAVGGMPEPVRALGAPWRNVQPSIAAINDIITATLADNKPARELQMGKLASQVKGWLKDTKLQGEVIGIDGTLGASMKAAFDKEGIKTTDGAEAMGDARKIKNRDEVECFRMGASIVDTCFYNFRKNIKPGVTENDLMAVAFDTGYRLGISGGLAHVQSGPHSWPNGGGPSDRMIRPGELIYSDIMFEYLGYVTCYYRTFCCGKPTQAQKDTYKRVHDWLYGAIKLMRPGASTKDVAEKFPPVKEYGWGKFYPTEDSAAMCQIGHGIGLAPFHYDSPFISRVWSLEIPEKIEPNMVIAMECISGTGEISPAYPTGQGVRIEEMLHITETGYEVLSKWPSEELTVCEL